MASLYQVHTMHNFKPEIVLLCEEYDKICVVSLTF